MLGKAGPWAEGKEVENHADTGVREVPFLMPLKPNLTLTKSSPVKPVGQHLGVEKERIGEGSRDSWAGEGTLLIKLSNPENVWKQTNLPA
jgi:hypothetical protein